MIQKSQKARTLVLFFTFLVLYIIVIARLYLIQVYKKDFFKILAKQQHTIEVTVSPQRAIIYDRDKIPLTLNREVISAFILPLQVKEYEKTAKFLKNNFGYVYRQFKKSQTKHFFWVQRNLTQHQIDKINKGGLKDIHLLKEPKRFYPFKSASPIIGFTNIDNKGLAGIELQFDKKLSGKPTTFKLQKDARSGFFYFEKEIEQQGKKGQSVELSLDNKLQFLVYEELKKTVKDYKAISGSVVIMDPDSGQILVMANYPSFNANEQIIKNLENTKNKIITDCFELGSIMKIFSALAALAENVTTIDEKIDCEGRVGYVDGFRVENWKPVGILSFSDVVKYSSNVGIAKVATRLGPKIYTHLKLLGFGSKTNIRFPGERSGFVNPPHNWSKYSPMAISFGYEIMATILQVAKAISVIASGGYSEDPVLVSVPKKPINSSRKKIYKDETIESIKTILETIGLRYFNFPGYKVMGKTGTARIIKNRKYSKKNHLYSFGGIVEKDNYRRVVVTFIKEPKEKKSDPNLWASQVAVPLFRNVVERMIIHDLT